jgi:parallel beta-helix repeat protein
MESQQRLTIGAALACLSPGDTLYIHGGTYTGQKNVINSQLFTLPSGTDWAPVTIAGVSGEVVILRPPSGFSAIEYGSPVAYTVVSDLVIDMVNSGSLPGRGGGASGVYVGYGANHNRFLRLEVKNSGANGFEFGNFHGNAPFNEVIDCRVHHNGQASGINNGYGFYIGTSDNIFEGNDVYANGGYGFHLYDNSGTPKVSRNIIRNNRIHGNGTHGGVNYGIVVAWGDGNQISGNSIYENLGGILVYTNSTNTEVANNWLYSNGPLESILIQYASGTILQNNAISDGLVLDLGTSTIYP